ncbi:MAG TPA: DUF2059 domain-containing protein [Caulobacteraceae bacterium]|nr:DUF2059 domain-containing protein [Caulobacteraceae bacterium]
MSGLTLLACGLAAPTASLALSEPSAAVQAPADPDLAERTALGREFAGLLLSSLDYRATAIAKLRANPTTATLLRMRPDWSDLLLKTADEAVQEETPIAEGMMGDALASNIPLDELRLGVEFFKTPAGGEFIRAIGEKESGKPITPLSDNAKKELTAFSKSAKGADFMVRLAETGKLLAPTMAKSYTLIAAKFLRRFGEKSEAIERSRLANLPPDNAAQLLAIRLIRDTHYMKYFKQGASRGVDQASAEQAIPGHPELTSAVGSSMVEAIDIDETEITRLIGRDLAQSYSEEELRADVAFLESPSGQALVAARDVKFSGHKPRPFTQKQTLAINRFASTTHGAAFFKKVKLTDEAATQAEPEYLPLITATCMRLAGESLAKSSALPSVS